MAKSKGARTKEEFINLLHKRFGSLVKAWRAISRATQARSPQGRTARSPIRAAQATGRLGRQEFLPIPQWYI